MRKILIIFAFLCPVSLALGSPSPNVSWDRGTPGSTWQEWDFGTDENPSVAENYYNPYDPEPLAFVTPVGISHGFEPGWAPSWHGRDGVWHAENIQLDLDIFNNPLPNDYKEIWVQVGFEGDFVGGDVIVAGQVIPIGVPQITLLPDGWKILDIGWRIEPNPDHEIILLDFINSGSSIDYVTVDTICIPEPATLCLLGLGGLLLGRKKRA